MRKASSWFSGSLSAAVLGAAFLLPAAAQAACPGLGATKLYGDCSPRGSYCEKHVVVGLTNDFYGRRGYVADIYRRNNQGWYFVTSMTAVCSAW
ncbi:MAG TPA: hypothetical protein VFE72_00730 [Lysobacter sp.]|nr:hypothetical protein [Lysobacter sp.]